MRSDGCAATTRTLCTGADGFNGGLAMSFSGQARKRRAMPNGNGWPGSRRSARFSSLPGILFGTRSLTRSRVSLLRLLPSGGNSF